MRVCMCWGSPVGKAPGATTYSCCARTSVARSEARCVSVRQALGLKLCVKLCGDLCVSVCEALYASSSLCLRNFVRVWSCFSLSVKLCVFYASKALCTSCLSLSVTLCVSVGVSNSVRKCCDISVIGSFSDAQESV